MINIEQTQDASKTPIYHLPIDIEIHTTSNIIKDVVWITKAQNEFKYTLTNIQDIKWVAIDPHRVLLAKKKYEQNAAAYFYQFNHSPSVLDKLDALNIYVKMRTNIQI